MFNSKILFAGISFILAILCFIPYLKDIFRRKTKPHIYSWLVWSILQFVGVLAIIIGGGSWGALSLGAGLFFCIFIFFVSIRYGTKNITRFDTLCLVASLIAIIIWVLQKDATISICLITLIDFVGFLPTIRKSYADPASETASLFFLSSIANIFSILALTNYTISTTLYVASLIVTNMACATIIFARRNILEKTKKKN